MKVVVLGIGNHFVADDAVGIRATGTLRDLIQDNRVSYAESERGGLDILERIEGFDKAIIADAAKTGREPPGTVSSVTLHHPFAPVRLHSLHTIGLDEVLALGLIGHLQLPDEVTLCTVEAADVETFGACCTPDVESAIPYLISRMIQHIRSFLPDLHVITRTCDVAWSFI